MFEIPLRFVATFVVILCTAFVVHISNEFLSVIIRKKKRSLGLKGFAKVIAHRGYTKIFHIYRKELTAWVGSRLEGSAENSLAAFQQAIQSGTNIVEFDIWLTKDEKIVVHHDETLERMTSGLCISKIKELNYADLPLLNPSNSEQHPSKEKQNIQYTSHQLKHIPLLEEVLQMVPKSVNMIVEFKESSDILIDKVHEMLIEMDRKEDVYWFSLTESINKKLRKKDPTIPTITSVIGMLKILFFYYLGILPWVDIEDAAFGITVEEISLEKIRKEKSIQNLPDWIKRVLAWLFVGRPPKLMIAPKLFRHLRERGIPVLFLGVNDENDLDLAVTSGATAVLTDRVTWMVSLIKDRNYQFKQIQDSE